ncbi:cysteine--tRNA ligase [Candidatus Saccharibacteria bacterium]|nr:cysteine--tRNA ligase [Candidatus Saccharibacteria bacterium]
MIKLKNTATKKLEEFKPINPNEVKIYSCGPTVYGYQHIGNYASYIYWDLLTRTMKLNGYNVKRIINLTDVGHLTSDEDDGEDKMEKGARKEGKTVWEIAEYYIDDFIKNYKLLNLLLPDKFCRATDYIEEDKKSVQTMIDKNYTYETEDGIYFDTSKFPEYANFARLDLEGLKAGARVDFNSEKKNVSDFAVWKFIKPGEKHAMRWDFLNRPGYPGWHLECSTIIHKELGEPIDIHTGGIDHIPIHHTNEIAQTYAMTEKPLAKYWLHCNFITIDNEKISKSLGNIYTLQDLAEKGFSPMDYKMWVLSGTYSGTRNFSFSDLEAVKNRRKNWRNKIAMIYQSTLKNADGSALETSEKNFKEKILNAVNNDLNSASAFALIDQLPETTSKSIWEFIDELFGLNLINDSPNITEEQTKLLAERKKAREEKNFEKSDELRSKLENTGISVKDTPNGQIWQYI